MGTENTLDCLETKTTLDEGWPGRSLVKKPTADCRWLHRNIAFSNMGVRASRHEMLRVCYAHCVRNIRSISSTCKDKTINEFSHVQLYGLANVGSSSATG